MLTGPQVYRSLKRLRGKQPATPSRLAVSSYAAAWRHYIRGNVVSQHACRHSEAFPKSVFQLCQQDMKVSLALHLEVTTLATPKQSTRPHIATVKKFEMLVKTL